jgi:Ca2+-binding RTX toxin-like protein
MSRSADLGTVGGLKVAAPGATVGGLTIADRLVTAFIFFSATPQTVNPANGSAYLPGPLESSGTSILLAVPPTEGEIEATRSALVAAGNDLFVPLNIAGALSTEEGEVVPPNGSNTLLTFADVPTPIDLSATINGVDLESTLGVNLVDFQETYGDDPDDVEPTVRANLAADNGILNGDDLPLDPNVLSEGLGLDPTYVGASVVADGQALLLTDLPVGVHTIRIEAELDTDDDGTVNRSVTTTYRVEVVEPIAGSARDDKLVGTRGNDIIFGKQGDDWLFGRNGNDRLVGDSGSDLLAGGGGDDVQLGGAGNDRACGGRGNDVILLGSGNDRALGGAGNDALLGEFGNDRLCGGAGDDTLAGGAGRDRLTGGCGSDTFQFAFGDGSDIVTDFDVEKDALRFFGAVYGGFGSKDELTIESHGSHTRISYGNAADPDVVLLWQVNASNLTDANFFFS